MSCCILGCRCEPEDIKWRMDVTFKTVYGSLIHTQIEGCKDHVPPDIFRKVTPEQKLKDGGH
jgi:hypothetical protein